jgi:hypothetical protein
MNRCGNCKFWGKGARTYPQASPEDQTTGEWRQCGRVQHDDHARCRPEDDIRDEYDFDPIRAEEMVEDPIRRELAVVTDGSGYFAALKCREDFGCVLFEPKEASA